MEEKEEKKSLAYRLGEALGTVVIGSIIVVVIALTAKFLSLLF
jgi:predicted membrane protein